MSRVLYVRGEWVTAEFLAFHEGGGSSRVEAPGAEVPVVFRRPNGTERFAWIPERVALDSADEALLVAAYQSGVEAPPVSAA